LFRHARRSESRCRLILAYARRDSVSPEIDAWYKTGMNRGRRIRFAAWGALLAMALHALSPLAAPAPRDAAGALHDICSSAPAAPQPAGDPSTSHCALCVPHASIAQGAVAVQDQSGFSFLVPLSLSPGLAVQPALTDHPARAPPASA
jgi:hypothetical protein